MCGRFTQKQIASKYVEELVPDWHGVAAGERPPTWNLAPSAQAWTIRAIDDHIHITLLKWGFGEKVAGKIQPPINARVETAPEKFMFRDAWQSQRCLVPGDGWYEWRAESDGKQPYYFSRVDGKPIYFAGIWTGQTFALFTTEADGHLTEIHHRKPVSLMGDLALTWMKNGMPTSEAVIASAANAESFIFHKVGKAVSNWRHDDQSLINPL